MNVNEFVILEAPKKQAEQKQEVYENEADEQILMFELPINSSSKNSLENDNMEDTVFFNLEEIEVQDHVEIIPITEVSGEGIKRYSLDDYQEVENRLNNAKPSKMLAEEVEDEEIVFEKRTISEPNTKDSDIQGEEDPLNSPITKILSDRTEERKRKMKEFNYKFKNSPSRIDEIEKQPASKRMVINLDYTKSEPNISRTSVNTDDDEIELRKNNSFLHDNVD